MLLLAACAPPAPADPAIVFKDRVCSAVVAAYRSGVRPASVDVVVPGPEAGDPTARVSLVAPGIPLAEHCLGVPGLSVPKASATERPKAATSQPATRDTRPQELAPSGARPGPLETRN